MNDSEIGGYLVMGMRLFGGLVFAGMMLAWYLGVAWQYIIGGAAIVIFLVALITMLKLRDITQKAERRK